MSEPNAGIDWTGTSEPMVRDILSQGETFLQAQFESALAADQRATTMASIQATASAALLGGVAALWNTGAPSVLEGGIAAAMVLLLAASFAAWAARPIDFFTPGSRPEQWYEARKADHITMLGGAAEQVQYAIDENEAFMEGNQTAVRVSLVLTILAPLVGLATGELF